MSERNLRQAALRGLKGQCPSCGETRLFGRFLKPVEHCPSCGQGWQHHQADDFPAYLVILLLGHLLVPIVIEVNLLLDPPMLFQMLFWPFLCGVVALLLIQPMKGVVIAWQWARRMHGFEKG
ncbi:DUF983 domain-containing protein [Sphingomonas sp. LaA6.9]|uniref:DUF983 domain-containing protein n=1 Tax=Sphingomonas sp. LaA6.9 TaxID=2919914 RepID=UPI001F5007F4|nr:DUF983 domain-containing protein [Sphingomonas sp. LaA6.9]MCJ8157535.1 DUF983 domain-containing protein [Sphingomonas sp. LaA6.9]